jgi:hypothetical protein
MAKCPVPYRIPVAGSAVSLASRRTIAPQQALTAMPAQGRDRDTSSYDKQQIWIQRKDGSGSAGLRQLG